jgi:hypothetical protein
MSDTYINDAANRSYPQRAHEILYTKRSHRKIPTKSSKKVINTTYLAYYTYTEEYILPFTMEQITEACNRVITKY